MSAVERFAKGLQRLLRHVGKRVLAEVAHDGALLIERIPEAPGPVRSPCGR